MTPTTSRRPPVLLSLAKVAALFVWALIVAEISIRLIHPQPRMPRYVTATAWGVRGNIPGAHYRHTTAEVDVSFAINHQGMRADRDYPEAKPDGVCRIALLGDSFMMGYELNLRDTIAARIEKGMNEAGHRVEVLNFAVSGFGTAESLRTYERFASHFDPDEVIMEWDRSDYDDNIRSDLYRLNPDGTLLETGSDFLPSVGLQERLMANPVYRWLVDNSDLYNFLREYLGLQVRNATAQLSSLTTSLRARLASHGHPNAASPEPTYAQPWAGGISPQSVALSAALLQKADAEITGQGRGFMILEIPLQYPAQQSVSSLSLLPRPVLSTLPVVSAVGAFNEATTSHKIFYEYGDGHITPFSVGLLVKPVLDRLLADPRFNRCGDKPA